MLSALRVALVLLAGCSGEAPPDPILRCEHECSDLDAIVVHSGLGTEDVPAIEAGLARATPCESLGDRTWRVPDSTGRGVCALRCERHGTMLVAWNHDTEWPLSVEFAPEVPLTGRVFDEERRPAPGVPLELWGWDTIPDCTHIFALWGGTTDDTGAYTVPFGSFLAREFSFDRGDSIKKLTFVTGGLAEPTSSSGTDLKDFVVSMPVTLRVPVHGSLRVRVLGEADAGLAGASVTVSDASDHCEATFVADVDGVATIPVVPLDACVTVRAAAEGKRGELSLSGPTTSGEVVETTIRLR